MSIRLGIPRCTARIVVPSIRQQSQHRIPTLYIRTLSVSAHEQPSKPSIIPPSQPSSSRETKRPETLYPPPAPPRNDPAPAPSPTTLTDHPLPQSSSSTPTVQHAITPKKEPKFSFKPLKAALTLTPNAISRLNQILDQPSPKLVRVGVKNRGCAGLAYHLEYVDKPGKFDEVVEQDGKSNSWL